jgi:hypothetical protein
MATEPPRLDAEQTQRALDRLAEGIVKLFGSSKPKSGPATSAPQPEAVAVAQPQAAAPAPNNGDTLERTLARFETMPQEMSELRRSLTDVLHSFESALDHLGIEAKRLSNESSSLALMADKLQMRLDQLQRTLNGDFAERRPAPAPVVQEAPAAPSEPQFRPSDQGVSVVLAPVTDYQELLNIQRALSNLPEAESASVVSFRNGEESLQLVLRTPVTARQIVDALAQATGEELLIEESRPDAQRLRLRFVEGEGRR